MKHHTTQQHTIVVGGGAIGLCVAWELATRGFHVTLFERDQVGRSSSWAAAGILPAASLHHTSDALDQLRGLSHQLFPQWTDKLRLITDIDCEFKRCGGVYLANTPGEHASMVGMTSYWADLGIECQPMSFEQLANREPALKSWSQRFPHGSAWWVRDECLLRPPKYLQALAAACRITGVEIRENAEVEDLDVHSHQAKIRVNKAWISADSLVLCGGCWTGRIAKRFQLESSLVPVRGQMLLLKTPSPVLRSVVNMGQRYILCRRDGHTLVGSCEEETGFELGTSEDTLDSLREFAIGLVPELRHAEQCDAWSGLRPLTFDGFPMIGRVPNTQNTFVAAGHYRSGVHLSPATAVTLADVMMGQTPQVSLDAFGVGKQQSKLDQTRFREDSIHA